MLDFFFLLEVKLPIVDRIHPRDNKFDMGLDNKATCESKLDDSLDSEEACNLTVSFDFPSKWTMLEFLRGLCCIIYRSTVSLHDD